MKSFTSTVLVISVFAGPVFSFAHGRNEPVPPVRHRHERIGLKDVQYSCPPNREKHDNGMGASKLDHCPEGHVAAWRA
jgi:hypothetical protein